MAEHNTTEGVYGPGSYTDAQFIPVPEDARRLLKHLVSITPGFTQDAKSLEDVEFTGSDLPIISGPIKAQVFSAVIHAMIGIASKEVLATKAIDAGKISINTDHAGLYPATPCLPAINGKHIPELARDGSLSKLGKDLDKGCLHRTPIRHRGWSIFPTKDKNVWYQLLANMRPEKMFTVFGLDENLAKTDEEGYQQLKAMTIQYSAPELEQKNMENGFCGQTIFSPAAWRKTLMAQALERRPLIDYSKAGSSDVPPIPFPVVLGDKRPLAGIRVVEFARVIAAPMCGAILASLGAEVVKVQSPHLPDPNLLQLTLTAGKYTCAVDLTLESDRRRVHTLLEGADVIVQAFRLRSLEHKGFGLADMVEMARKRNKGIVYLDINCYGQEGTYAERPGYQQIADAASGCSYITAKAYGFEEGTGVLPSLPISDMICGAVGALEVVLALRDRARHGGSYHASSVLVAADTTQVSPAFGLYLPEIVQKIQETYKFAAMTPVHHGEELLQVVFEAWRDHTDLLSRKEFFTTFVNGTIAEEHTILAPVVKFEDKAASPGWKHGPAAYCEHTELGWGLDKARS